MQNRPSKALNIILWIVQFLIAATLIWAGSMKLFNPAALPWPWIRGNPGLVKLTGMFDLLGGLGLLVPAMLRIQPRLTVIAAICTVVLMVCASVFHISRGEASQIGFNIVVALLAAFVAWGRMAKARIQSRTTGEG